MQATNKVDIRLPRPHSQGQFLLLDRRYNDVAFCGRRWGKTQVGVYRILAGATDPNAIGLYWWVGLSWRSASMKRAWRLLKFYVRKIWRALGRQDNDFIHEVAKELDLPNGSNIWLRTAENPESLAGEGIRGVVGDEFTLWREFVWTEYLEATLLDYPDAWVLFIGVPKPNSWAVKIWNQAPDRPKWRNHHYTTYDNPKIDRAKIDDIKNNIPKLLFEQEYLAQVVPGEGAVFRKIRDAAILQPATPYAGRFCMGVDFAQMHDYTVITVLDADTKRMVAVDRFHKIDWLLQRQRIKALAEQWQPQTILCEINSIGSPNFEALAYDGLPVEAFETTATSKPPLIQSLALAFERGELQILNDAILIGELEAFEVQVNPQTGRPKYAAPDGLHDDMVMSLALAFEAANRPLWWIR